MGTHDLLGALFGVTRSTTSRAVQEVQPVLAEHGHTIPPSTARFRTPADVAAFLTPESAQRKIKSAC
ncbi:transposase family protein [Streptomyces sp. NPDC087903]|uniref:transposase family protein n=1 Tax=Streptomyces sp. NPDC087903 TaxID=3365819 RepID=UPI003819CB97